MNHLFKRALSLLLALAMIFTMVPGAGLHVHAEEVEEHLHATEAAMEVVETEPAETPASTTETETEAPVETTEAAVETETQVEEPEAPVETEAEVDETEAPVIPEPTQTEAPQETEAVLEEATEATEEMLSASAEAAMAATTVSGHTVTGLIASYDAKNNVSCTASGNTITVNATSSSTVGTTSTTLTLANDLGSDATLKFDWTVSGGSLTAAAEVSGAISGATNKTSNGTYEAVIVDGGSITISLKSPRNKQTGTLSITGISLISTTAADPNLTFKAPINGYYTVDGTPLTEDNTMTVKAGTEITLAATAADGYNFFGWQIEDGTYLSQADEFVLTASADATITPVFIKDSIALFGVGTQKFMDLTEAGLAAAAGSVKTIILLNDGTVSGSHTIPEGTTLLIPYNDANTAYGANASCTSYSSILNNSGHIAWVSPTAYRTLTLASDADITVNGSIEVSGRHAAAGGGTGMYGGSPTGPLGYINMLSGSHIDLEPGANLYAWGYVYGDGTITVKNGASIYENFQIMDFRGGSVTLELAGDFMVFPLSQYYVQNVEVATRYEYGSTEYIATSIFMSNQCHSASVKFIGSGAMFQPTEGAYFVKDYNPATDTLDMHAYGDSAMASMNLELGGTAINSADFVLPITNNIRIFLHSGTTTLKQNMMLLPGSSLTVDQGATLNLAYTDATGAVVTAGGYVLQVFDSENWVTGLNTDTFETVTGTNYVHPTRKFRPVQYTATARKTRTEADLKDVTLDINGNVITDGFLYSTVTFSDILNDDFSVASGGANIISSGKSGTVAMNNGAGQDMLGYLYDQSKASYFGVPLASAQLKNGDGTMLDTTGAEAGTIYNYCAIHDCWYTGECDKTNTVSFDANGGTGTMDAVPVKCGQTYTLPECTFTRTNYEFVGWNVNNASKMPGETITLTSNVTVKADWVASTFKVTWMNGTTEIYNEDVAPGVIPSFRAEEETPTKASDATSHYTFAGWSTSENGAAVSNLPAVTEDTTFYAIFNAEAHNGTDDGDCTTAVTCPCGYEQVAAKTHNMQQTSEKVEAECEKPGKEAVYTCANNCNYTTGGEAIAALEHNWGEPVSYTVNDNGTHTAHYVCANDPTHTKSDAPAGHDYKDNHTCVCGVVETFTVTYTFNGGDWGGFTEDEVYTFEYGWKLVPNNGSGSTNYGEVVWLVGVVRHGYDFAGWLASTDGKTYDPDVDTDTYTLTGDVTFTAQWTCRHETTEAVDNGDGTHKILCDCGETIAENQPHDFDNDAHTCVCDAVETYTVTWIVNGEKYDETTVTYGAAVTVPAYTVPTGYKFSGWDVPATMPAEDLTLNATLTKCVARIGDDYYTNFFDAMKDAQDGETVTLLADIPLYTRFILSLYVTDGKAVTIDGDGYKLYADNPWGTGNGKHLINVNVDNITLKNITLDCNNIAKGVNIITAQNIVFDNVSIINDSWLGLTVNSSTLTVKNYLKSSMIDVDVGSVVDTLGFVVEDGTIIDGSIRWTDPAAYPNSDADKALKTDGITPYYKVKKLNTTGGLNGYTNSLSRLSNGYGAKLLDNLTQTSALTLLNADHTGTLDLNGKTLTVNTGKAITVNGALTVTGEGTIAGQLILGNVNASITAPEGLNVNSGVANYHVVYENGTYSLAIDTYTITWKNVDGTTLAFTNAEYNTTPAFPAGQTPIYPDAMAETGYEYTHIGWSGSVDGEKLETIPAVTGEAIYYAVYEKTAKNYLVTWTVDGVWFKENYFAFGSAITAPEMTQTKEGYTFSGWTVPETMPAKNITLDATWSVNTYKVYWTVNGEAYGVPTEVKFGEIITAPAYTAAAGYTFSGWDVPATMPAKDVTLNATLTANTYTVTWTVDGVTFATTEATFGQAIDLPEKAPTKTGYTFTKWVDVPETMPADENLTIAAAFTANKYQVAWFANGGTFKVATIEQGRVGTDVAYDAVIAFTNFNLPVREGYTFTGWNTQADGKGNDLTAETVMNTTDNLTAYYAQWEANKYAYTIETYTMDVDGSYGEPVTASYEAPYGTLVEVPAAESQGFTLDAQKSNTSITIGTDESENVIRLYFARNRYTLTVVEYYPEYKEVKLQVPYGANLLETLEKAAEEGKLTAIGTSIPVKDQYCRGEYIVDRYYNYDLEEWVEEDTTMPADPMEIQQQSYNIGWMYRYDGNGNYLGAEYFGDYGYWLSEPGWYFIEKNYDDVEGGAWYYFQQSTRDEVDYNFRAEGLTRATYPTETINGNTYAPDAETLAYCESKGIEFLDKNEAWFFFGQDGQFQSDFTGIVPSEDGPSRYAVNGMLTWHPGAVEVDGTCYYFIGDEEIGGNILATGDVYVQRNNTDRTFVTGGIYTFAEDGKLCEYDGITDMANGTKRYYKNARLMAGNGLTEVDGNYIYVRHNGELVVNSNYYIAGPNLPIVPGMYDFDSHGYLINPVSTEKNGVYEEGGKLYYYEDGLVAYNAGLIYGTFTWHLDEGNAEHTGYIYVRSNGQLATSKYWITTVNDTGYAQGFYTFSDIGLMDNVKNGILAENGSLYYYVANKLQYNAGVIELNGKYYYVRSNGEVVNNRSYWITNVGQSGLVAKLYTFDENGVMQEPVKVGTADIIDGYYYVNGNKAYGAGIVKLSDENGEFYIYVRSDGSLATGEYWPTTLNGYNELEGMQDFGESGKLYI